MVLYFKSFCNIYWYFLKVFLAISESNPSCPVCGDDKISPESLHPNRNVREAVQNFHNETGYSYWKTKEQGQKQDAAGLPTVLSKLMNPLKQQLEQLAQRTMSSSSTPPLPTTTTRYPFQQGLHGQAGFAPNQRPVAAATVFSTATIPPVRIVPQLAPSSTPQQQQHPVAQLASDSAQSQPKPAPIDHTTPQPPSSAPPPASTSVQNVQALQHVVVSDSAPIAAATTFTVAPAAVIQAIHSYAFSSRLEYFIMKIP